MADVEVRDADGVNVVTLSRPDSLNALTLELLDALLGAFDRAQSVGAPVVVTGSGRAFCAGADLAALADAPSGGTLGATVARRMQTHFNEVPRRIASLGVPVVAAVNGVTAGGGIGLALAADVVLAGTSASFTNVFAQQLGLIPDMGASWAVPRAIGRSRAQAWALLGDRIDAATAASWGLVHEVVADDDLVAAATDVARRLGRLPAATLLAVRRSVEESTAPLAEALVAEWETQADLIDRGHLVEGIDAFFAGRRPEFGA